MTTSAPRPVNIPLWPEEPAGVKDRSQHEQETVMPFTGFKLVRNVMQPTLTAYLPDPSMATGAAIICPGGGFHFYSLDNEGTDVARWFTTQGVAAFVLKYRLIPTPARSSSIAGAGSGRKWRGFSRIDGGAISIKTQQMQQTNSVFSEKKLQ